MYSRSWLYAAAITLAVASAGATCQSNVGDESDRDETPASAGDENQTDKRAASAGPGPPKPLEEAPEPTGRLDRSPTADKLSDRVDSYFENRPGRRMYVQVDKPLYRPGETIWAKSWNLEARDLSGVRENPGVVFTLVDPRGNDIQTKRVRERGGHAHVDLQLARNARGGRYTLRVQSLDGAGTVERPVVVSDFEEPRIKKNLEFVREAYGEGDRVVATLKLRRGTDEPLGKHPVTGVVRVDGSQHTEVSTQTGPGGTARVEFELPDEMDRGDGILTVQVSDGGVTESISRRIPIVLDAIDLEFFPEGGDLVAGLPSRIYFAAEKPNGEPADVAGHVENDDGETVAEFESFKKGMGRLALTPKPGETYTAVLEKPAGVEQTTELPKARTSGCVMRHFDDFRGKRAATRVSVRCTESRRVVVSGFMRNNPLDVAPVNVPADGPAVVYLEPDNAALAKWQGVARITLFDADLDPLAERLVYRRWDKRLRVDVEPQGETYGPRDEVELKITTSGPDGEPLPARVALSVVDDKVVSFADSETPHLLSRLLLEPEIPGEIDKPNEYFDRDEKGAAYALDLLMGTRGYREFEWKPVLDPEARDEPDGDSPETRAEFRRRVQARAKMAQPRAEEGAAQPDEAEGGEPEAGGARMYDFGDDVVEGNLAKPNAAEMEARQGIDAPRMPAKKEPPAGRAPPRHRWAKVREFPTPDYSDEREGPRDDFRDTVYWNPDVSTGNDGEATVEFYLSDAVTSFRVFTEGIGGGYPGRDETVFESSLPFSIAATLPLEVSEGDRAVVPVTLINDRDEKRTVELTASFGDLLALDDEAASEQTVELDGGERTSRYFALDVVGDRGTSRVRLAAEADGLTDAVEREISVAPRGFPRRIARSGQLENEASHSVDLSDARKGTVVAALEVYPNPVSSMTDGMEGLVREPTGCFEQASSANYPNVMLLKYLRESGAPAPDVVSRAKSKMGAGYDKLLGYETDEQGFEWFGHTPPHEALTAYGLLQFTQMREVWGNVEASLVDRTAEWLISRRDDDGGYRRSDQALDSFGRASETVTDAYITYALTETGRSDRISKQIDRQSERVRQTDDAYVLALATNTMLNAGRKSDAKTGVDRLLEMQASDGSWTNADHSITKSRGSNLHVETTSLATLALLENRGHGTAVRHAIEWINARRTSRGTWGATQATILALQALTRYSERRRQQLGPGSLRVVVGGETVAERSYTTERTEPLRVGLSDALARGDNDVRLIRTKGEGKLPYTLAAEYRTDDPATSPGAPVSLELELADDQLEMGDTVRLTATIENETDRGLGMTLARVALPGGLTTQKWQLEELQNDGPIAFYETRSREVILYVRQMKPDQTIEVPLELKTTVPGDYTAQSSRAYPYYNDTDKYWVDPLAVTVAR